MKNAKEVSAILSAIYCINRTSEREDNDIDNLLDYAFWRLFGANRNLLMLACIGQTKESIMPQVTAMLFSFWFRFLRKRKRTKYKTIPYRFILCPLLYGAFQSKSEILIRLRLTF